MSSVITKESVHRLLTDVRQIMKNPLNENGIYYTHDESDMLKGWAMIVGPSDTPYFGGFYFFKFKFPSDYPYSPPIVTYHTNDGHIRFNPNLYINGKVCLSVLNTWRGEPWSACQTISTVLLTLCTVFCQNPITNEPGLTVKCPDCIPYNEILTHANIRVAICDVLDKVERCDEYDPFIPLFSNAIQSEFNKNRSAIICFLEHAKTRPSYLMHTRLYGLREPIDYLNLYSRFTHFKLK